MATFEYTVTVEVERVDGAVASHDSVDERIREQLGDAIDSLDLDYLGPQETSTYEVIDSAIDGGYVKPARKPKRVTFTPAEQAAPLAAEGAEQLVVRPNGTLGSERS
jgi:hypothetical protein